MTDFNDFYWTVDEFRAMCGRWMDNVLVFVVSSLHKSVKEIRRKR